MKTVKLTMLCSGYSLNFAKIRNFMQRGTLFTATAEIDIYKINKYSSYSLVNSTALPIVRKVFKTSLNRIVTSLSKASLSQYAIIIRFPEGQ